MALDLRFIGTGGAFDHELGNSAALVSLDGLTLLVDCGHTVYPRLRQLGRVDQPDVVLITHLHDDHVGSLSTLLYHRHFFTPQRRLRVLVPDARFGELLLGYLSYAMQDARAYASFEPFEAVPGLRALDTTGRHVPDMVSYAFHFTDSAGDSLTFSGDLGDGRCLFDWLRAEGLRPRVVYHDLGFYPHVSAHAHYSVLAEAGRGFQLVGYHHDHRMAPPDCGIPLAAQLPGLVLG